DAVWRTAFDADRSILGRQVRINNDTGYKDTYTVVGVMPPGFRYPAGKIYAGEVWIPLQLGDNDKLRAWNAPYYEVIARLRRVMVEGLGLSAAAALLGAGLASSSVRLLAHELTQRLPLPVPAMPDGWILGVLLALTVVSALIASAWPAWMAARNPIEPALRQGGAQTGTGRKHHRMRGALVAAEIALSLTLLVGCGLLLQTINSLHHVTRSE